MIKDFEGNTEDDWLESKDDGSRDMSDPEINASLIREFHELRDTQAKTFDTMAQHLVAPTIFVFSRIAL